MNTIRVKVPAGMDVVSALELASSKTFCEGAMCNDATQGICELKLAAGVEPQHVHKQLEEMGFSVLEGTQKSVVARIRNVFGF